MTFKLFLDCDGVLADFDRHFEELTGHNPRSYEERHGTGPFWKIISHAKGGFFNQLKKMPDADNLVEAVRHTRPTILTGIPNGSWAIKEKLTWRMDNYPDLPMTCCASKDKKLAKDPSVTNVLVDDWTKYKDAWEENGDVFIHHTSAENSIRQLRELGVI
jgi:hypothetical protein